MKKIIHYLQKTILSALLILFAGNVCAQESTKPVLTANSAPGMVGFFEESADGSFHVTGGSNSGIIIIRDVKTGRKIRKIPGSGQMLTSLDLSLDGKTIAAGDFAGNLTFWEVQTGKKIRTISVGSRLLELLDFAPDGKNIVASAGNDINIYDVSSGMLHLELSAWGIYRSVDYSPDGRRLVTGDNEGMITIWSSSDGREIRTMESSSYEVKAIFNPDGTRIVSKTGDGTIQIWDARTGKELNTIPWDAPTWDELNAIPGLDKANLDYLKDYDKSTFKGAIGGYNSNIAINPNGKSIAYYRINEGIRIRDINNGKVLNTIKSDRISKVWYLSDGILVSADGYGLKIRMWNTETGESVDNSERDASVPGQLPLSLFKKFKLPHKDTNVESLNPRASELYQNLTDGVTHVEVSSDDLHIVAVDIETKDLQIWDVETGQLLNEVNVTGHSKLITGHSVSPDRSLYVTADFEGLVIAWDIRTGRRLWSAEVEEMGGVKELTFNEDGSHLMGVTLQQKVKAWDSSTGREVQPSDRWAWELENTNHETLAKNSTGNRLLIASYELDGYVQKSTLSIREFNSGGKDRHLFNSSSLILTGAFSPDERRVVACNQEGLVKIWDLETGQDLTLESNSVVHPVQFSPDGHYVIGGSDGGLRYWDSRSGKLLMTLYGGQGTDDWVAVAPDGRFDGTPKGMEVLHYVQGMEVIPLESYFEEYYTPNLIPRLMAGDTFAELKSVEETSLPPEVAFTSPGDGLASEDKQVTIELTVTGKGGGVDEVRLYQNGKLITGTQRGLQLSGTSDNYSFDVTLTRGENRFKAVALNSDRVESIPEYLVVNYEGATSRTRLFTLTIGINEYKNPKYSLNYARSDASGFEEQIIQGGASIFDSVVQTSITDAEATKQNIFAALDKIKSAAGPEDMFVFYYAGHGVMSDPVTGSSEFYMAPTDVTQLYGNERLLKSHGIAASEIQEYSKNIMAQKQLFVLDACQSGGATEMLAMRGAAEEKAIAQLARSTGTFWLTASGSEQFATEFAELGHGVFTYAILEGLSGSADQGTGDGKITVQELSAFLNDRVPELTQIHKGQAQYPSSYGYGQDFPISIIQN